MFVYIQNDVTRTVRLNIDTLPHRYCSIIEVELQYGMDWTQESGIRILRISLITKVICFRYGGT